eukprot:UN01905
MRQFACFFHFSSNENLSLDRASLVMIELLYFFEF